MRFNLIIISEPGRSYIDFKRAVESFGEDSDAFKFDGIVYQVIGGILSRVDGERAYQMPIRNIDLADDEPFSDGRIRHIIVGQKEDREPRRFADAIDCVITPDGKWHEPEERRDRKKWDEFIEGAILSAGGDHIVTMYDLHR